LKFVVQPKIGDYFILKKRKQTQPSSIIMPNNKVRIVFPGAFDFEKYKFVYYTTFSFFFRQQKNSASLSGPLLYEEGVVVEGNISITSTIKS